MYHGVTDIAQARAKRDDAPISLPREPLTVICQIANARPDAEVLRQVGFSDALRFEELYEVIAACFGFPDEDAPWHFYQHRDARGQRIDPTHQVSEFLWREGDQIDFVWGLWDFQLVVEDIYPRDKGTPRALCVGGSGALFADFDVTAINAALTGEDTIEEVLEQVNPAVREVIQRSQLFDFVPLLQAMDLHREVNLPAGVDRILSTLPQEDDAKAADAFWASALAASCLSGPELSDTVAETTMAALGWGELTGEEIRSACRGSWEQLAHVGAVGPNALAPVYRLDIYRALLRG